MQEKKAVGVLSVEEVEEEAEVGEAMATMVTETLDPQRVVEVDIIRAATSVQIGLVSLKVVSVKLIN